MINNLDLDRLFNPKRVAMIGASANFGKWGNIILFNILKAGFKGEIVPVNPKKKSILGLDCYASVGDIPGEIDLAIITTPSKFVLSMMDEIGAKKIPFAIVVTANFSEAGEVGKAEEVELVASAKKNGIRLVGPNTMGIFSSKSCLHALMPMLMPLHGTVSMFSQSGNVGVQMMDYGQNENVGFEKFVSSGNEGDLSCNDYLNYFAHDKNTKVIIGYIEGIEDGSTFLPIAKMASRKKPIIIMKGGRTRTGSKAAASHTGSMAGSFKINLAAFRQAGIIEAHTSLELIDCAKAFSHYPIPKGNRVGIVTRGGGWGVIAADSCEEAGLEVPELPADIIKEIDKLLPDYWNRGNPIDMVATISHDPMTQIIRLLAEWDGVDSVIALGAGFRSFKIQHSSTTQFSKEVQESLDFLGDLRKQDADKPDPVLQYISDLVKETKKPIFSVSTGSDYAHKHYFENYEIVSYPTPERAVRVLKHMCEYGCYISSL